MVQGGDGTGRRVDGLVRRFGLGDDRRRHRQRADRKLAVVRLGGPQLGALQDVERPLCADTAEERSDREGGGGTGHSPAGLLDLIDGAESAGDGADRGDQLIGAVFARLKGLQNACKALASA